MAEDFQSWHETDNSFFPEDKDYNQDESNTLPSMSETLASESNSNLDNRDVLFDMEERIKQVESEKLSLMVDHNNLIREFNKRMSGHLEEIRMLKEVNQRIETESQEMRDLCCYLDDDRQKCRKLAKEWQRFGRYTVTVMRNEVMSYQEKLKDLEEKQLEFIRENGELRDLCVYLDSSRGGEDGQPSELNHETLLKYFVCHDCNTLRKLGEYSGVKSGYDSISRHSKDSSSGRDSPHQEYVKMLEQRIRHLEEEREVLISGTLKGKEKKRVSFQFPDDDSDIFDKLAALKEGGSSNGLSSRDQQGHNAGILRNGLRTPPPFKDIFNMPGPSMSKSKHDAIVQAMKVMDIQDRLDKSSLSSQDSLSLDKCDHLSENEVAVLKELCNVVWRKLSDEEIPLPSPTALDDNHINGDNGLHKTDRNGNAMAPHDNSEKQPMAFC